MVNFVVTALNSMRETVAVCVLGAVLLVLAKSALLEGHLFASSLATLSAIPSVIADLGSF